MVYHGFPMFTSTIQWMDKLFPPTPFAEADWYDMPHDVLARISNRIINEAVFDASGHWVRSEVLMDIDGRWKKKLLLFHHTKLLNTFVPWLLFVFNYDSLSFNHICLVWSYVFRFSVVQTAKCRLSCHPNMGMNGSFSLFVHSKWFQISLQG